MCWRLLCVLAENTVIPKEINRAYSIKPITGYLPAESGLMCYEISNGMCACGILQMPLERENNNEKLVKKWRRQGLSETAILRRLSDQQRIMQHKQANFYAETVLDKWLATQNQAFLLAQWQDSHLEFIPFSDSGKTISAINEIPENCWVAYHSDK